MAIDGATTQSLEKKFGAAPEEVKTLIRFDVKHDGDSESERVDLF